MKPTYRMRVVIIGAGNLGATLALSLLLHKDIKVQIYDRNIKKAKKVCARMNAKCTDDLSQLDPLADIYVMAVTDDAISEVVSKMPEVKGVVAHTSGATSIDVLQRFKNRAVFYPLQSFTLDRRVDFSETTIFIESNNVKSRKVVTEYAKNYTEEIRPLDSRKRLIMHLAAVFSSNFINRMLLASETVMKKNKMNFRYLRQLVKETVDKGFSLTPKVAQTGPARRNDVEIMEKHLNLLRDMNEPKLADFYKQMSDWIIEDYRGVGN